MELEWLLTPIKYCNTCYVSDIVTYIFPSSDFPYLRYRYKSLRKNAIKTHNLEYHRHNRANSTRLQLATFFTLIYPLIPPPSPSNNFLANFSSDSPRLRLAAYSPIFLLACFLLFSTTIKEREREEISFVYLPIQCHRQQVGSLDRWRVVGIPRLSRTRAYRRRAPTNARGPRTRKNELWVKIGPST